MGEAEVMGGVKGGREAWSAKVARHSKHTSAVQRCFTGDACPEM